MRLMTNAAMLLFFALCGLSISSTAQQTKNFRDDLLKDREETLAKYLPRAKSNYLFALFAIPPNELLGKLAGFKAEMKKQVDVEQDAAIKALMLKDIDFYSRNQLGTYLQWYGLDSIGNAKFNELIKKRTDDPNHAKLISDAKKNAYVKTMDSAERKKLEGMIYEEADLSDSALFIRSAAYREWIEGQIRNLLDMKNYEAEMPKLGAWGATYAGNLNVIKSKIAPGFVKDYLTYDNTISVIKTANDDAAKDQAYQYFMASVKVPAYVKEVEEIYSNFKNVVVNSISPDFNYADVNGKMTSLKSLRGKYVYIDIWATWCGPCVAEIPFLAKLEKDYHGKNIHFVSISVDKMANKGKWLDHIKANKMGGIQLLADNDFGSDFMKQYNVSTIPRFLLIDPTGKIVSVDAKRPSDPEFRKQLDALLK